ncbi:uncharacterized protein LOC123317262 [Coccinella septempunctata]|uniref:uncharacterized protein LOC123317262 n=1 Tax=Coccinella septempunctata TaxID=41139 RepID=UPI001D080AF9|nr:uncharacterized protein LOC123317262 [Coccinella septempunctata]
MSAGGSAGSGGGSGGSTSTAALRAAAAKGNVAACARILGGQRCVRFSRDELGRSALHLAAQGGHAPVVRLLLGVAAPKEVDSPDGDGCTALQRAAADGHEEVIKLLLARGADADKQDSVHGNSALHEASWKGYSKTIRLLAAAGAKLDSPNAGGFTPLHLCCQNGHNQSCRELLLAGCDVDMKNHYGDTSLHTAARYGHAGVTRILISAQCKVSEQNKNGDTALHIAAAMGRRKLTRIILEAGCDKRVRNKQGETARDIAIRKDLHEILSILDDCTGFRRDKKSTRSKKPRGKSKVRFEAKEGDDTLELAKGRHWSPYGCHYYPDPEAFPSPRLDSLPQEPLKKGEQYYLDLAGNIRKGPVGVGYTCYCAPLFRHIEAKMEKDKRELQKAQLRLGQRVAGLEQKLNRGVLGRRSERVTMMNKEAQEPQLPRSRSLEMLDSIEKGPLQSTRSMDELDNDNNPDQRPTVKELVARIQQQQSEKQRDGDNSESSDDEDSPIRFSQQLGIMGDSNLSNIPSELPRSRSGVYNADLGGAVYDPGPSRHLEPTVIINHGRSSNEHSAESQASYVGDNSRYYNHHNAVSTKYVDLNSRFAKLRVLDGRNNNESASRMMDGGKIFESTARMLESAHDTADRDTNNDSGYSTKVYGSSKGNSPSLSGQLEGEIPGASSLV